jgi:hypothetical protein
MLQKNPSKHKSTGRRANGHCDRASPQWYDSNLSSEIIPNPSSLNFGLLRTPSFNQQHTPFHLQKEASLEAAIVAEKVIKKMNSIREARLRIASDLPECKMSVADVSAAHFPTSSYQGCTTDTGVAQWTIMMASSTSYSKPFEVTSREQGCTCKALKLLGACRACGSQKPCRSPLDTGSDDEIDRAFELIKLRQENMPLRGSQMISTRKGEKRFISTAKNSQNKPGV